jgi:hypothetical protein
MRPWRTIVTGTLVFWLASPAIAQEATFKGRVVVDSLETPIAGAIVSIESLQLSAQTDSTGAFVMRGIRPGAYVVMVKRVGFGALATRMRFTARETVEADFLMTPNVQPLPDVKVETKAPPPPKLVEFEERRNAGAGGRFLTQADFEKRAWSFTSDVLRQLPGIDLVRDRNRPSQYYVAAGRLQGLGRGSEVTGGGFCFAAVVVDGAFVYQGLPGELPFDINSLGPGAIAGLEYYASTASIPTKYNSSGRNTCGLVVVWTRVK